MDVAAASFFGSTALPGGAVAETALAGMDFQRAVDALTDALPAVTRVATPPPAIAAPRTPPMAGELPVQADQADLPVSEAIAGPAILIPRRSGPVMLAVAVAAPPVADAPSFVGTAAVATAPVKTVPDPQSPTIEEPPVPAVRGEPDKTVRDEPAKGRALPAQAPKDIATAASQLPMPEAPREAPPAAALPEAAVADADAPEAPRRKVSAKSAPDDAAAPQPLARAEPAPPLAPLVAPAPVAASQPEPIENSRPRQEGQAEVRVAAAPAAYSQSPAPREAAAPQGPAAFPAVSGEQQQPAQAADRQVTTAPEASPKLLSLPLTEVAADAPRAPAPQGPAVYRAKRASGPEPLISPADRGSIQPLRPEIFQAIEARPQPRSHPAPTGDQPPANSVVAVPDRAPQPAAAAVAPALDLPASGGPAAIGAVPASFHTPPAAAAAAIPVPMAYRPTQFAHDLGIVVAHSVSNGDREVTIRMEPADFGRIDVRLAFDDSGKLRATVGADNPVVLDLLRRDVANLVGAMSDAGISSDQRSFRFEAQADSSQGQRQWASGDGQPRDPRQQSGREPVLRPVEEPESTVFQPLRWAGRIDVTA